MLVRVFVCLSVCLFVTKIRVKVFSADRDRNRPRFFFYRTGNQISHVSDMGLGTPRCVAAAPGPKNRFFSIS